MDEIKYSINNYNEYIATDIDTVKVDDVYFSKYSDYVFEWKKTFNQQIGRSQNGSMGDTENYAFFITPYLTLKYDIMPIRMYRLMMKQYLEKMEMTVTCYDPIYDKLTTNKMYYGTPSSPEYVTQPHIDDSGKEIASIIGVKNFTVELIGTNNENTN